MKKRSRLRLILVIAIVVLLIGAFLVNKYWLSGSDIPAESGSVTAPAKGRGGSGKPIPVMVALAKDEIIIDGIRAVGSTVPNEEVDISSEVAGKVQSINFTEGSRVSKGDLLVKVNDDDLQAQYKRYHFQEQNLSKKLERQRILFEKEAISGEMFDQVQTEYNVLLADIELIKVKIDRSAIKAPFSGTIGFRNVSDGSYIQVGSKIARLVDYNTLKVEFSIPEKYISMPLVGSTVYFTTKADDGKRHTAKVYAMEPKVDDKTRTIVLRALFDNSAGVLRPGMSVSVIIPTTGTVSVLTIPTEAIIPAMDSKSVWVVSNGEPVMRVVQTGTRLADRIEITDGLLAGDSVIVTGLMHLREGAKISVTN